MRVLCVSTCSAGGNASINNRSFMGRGRVVGRFSCSGDFAFPGERGAWIVWLARSYVMIRDEDFLGNIV